MFYSAELLSKKTPLSVVWLAAHGKKLPRGRILSVDVASTAEKIAEPQESLGGPTALRLQSVLVSGLVTVFSRQSTFLLDDCHDATRRLALAGGAAAGAPGAADAAFAAADDITLRDVVPGPGALELFPAFAPARLGAGIDDAEAEGLFLLPSLGGDGEGASAGRRGARSAASQGASEGALAAPLAQHSFLMMDAPGADAFEAMLAQEAPGGLDELFDAPAPPPPEEPGSGRGAAPAAGGAAGAAARQAAGRGARRRRPTIDALDAILIPAEEFARLHNDRSELLIRRPRLAPPPPPAPFAEGPASGPWGCKELMDIWRAAMAPAALRGNAKRRAGGDDAAGGKRGRGGDAASPDENGRGPQAEGGPAFQDLPMDLDAPPYGGYGLSPPGGAAWGDDPFAAAAVRRASGGASPGGDAETERLRAALQGTPRGDGRDLLLALGLTPTGSHPSAGPAAARRASARLRSGSDRSAERGGRLSGDLGADLGLLGPLGGDLGAALPAIGEDDARGASAGLTQFTLPEETAEPTAPSAAPRASAGAADALQTAAVLESVHASLGAGRTASLFAVTAALSRREAAMFFSHLLSESSQTCVRLFVRTFCPRLQLPLTRRPLRTPLFPHAVGFSKDMIGVEQTQPFADIKITFKI
jgi:hypothetical protein